MEYWEFDFLASHLLNNEDVRFYDEDGGYAEIVATAEGNDSTAVFHGKRDVFSAWLKVFSLDEGLSLGDRYLEEMTENRVDAVNEQSRDVYNV